MPCDAARVWWLYGSSCAGKSVTAWELFTQVTAGEPRAYFDVDQVGMCYPEDELDPGRYALKARAAGVLLRHLTAAGACTVIVSGVLDQRSMRAVVEEADGAVVTCCRIRVEAEELTRRLTARYDPEVVVSVLAEAREWDQLTVGRPVVDTGEGTPSMPRIGPGSSSEKPSPNRRRRGPSAQHHRSRCRRSALGLPC